MLSQPAYCPLKENWKTLQTMNPTRAKQKITAPTERSTESTAKMGPDRTITPKPKRASQPIFRNTTQVDSRFSMMTTPELEEISQRSPTIRKEPSACCPIRRPE